MMVGVDKPSKSVSDQVLFVPLPEAGVPQVTAIYDAGSSCANMEKRLLLMVDQVLLEIS